MTWLKYITIHPGIKIRLQYIRNKDEYISKLQLHQQVRPLLGESNKLSENFNLNTIEGLPTMT